MRLMPAHIATYDTQEKPMRDVSNMDDVIDVRDVIERFEDLEATRENECCGEDDATDATLLAAFDATTEGQEYKTLGDFLAEMKGNGGDEQWRGDWYPVTAIRDTHFENYAQELAEDCAPFSRNSPEGKALEMWPYRCIDWKQAARELQMDYTSIDFDGVTYWVR